jgi:site-specific DNA-methyltransferase (adenine-specific)
VSDFEILVGDCRQALKLLGDAAIDCVVCDPPYELGFMGKAWDASGVAYDPAVWREVLRVLKPGGHVVAFGGTRTYHRMASAIEDAGFEVRDMLEWLYGSGFPKSLDVSKAIDATLGLPVTPEAAKWKGWGTALKPAHEPVVLARKPLGNTVARTVLEHGTGALNIGATRVGTEERHNPPAVTKWTDQGYQGRAAEGKNVSGRWPSNIAVDEAVAADLGSVAPYFYCAKPSTAERDAGLEGFAVRTGGDLTAREDGTAGLRSPRAGAGRGGGRRNHHPTVKPIALMRWLCRLVCPPGGVVLDPFTGSGTTGCAAVLEGFDFLGVEMDPEYVKLAEARIAHWKMKEPT